MTSALQGAGLAAFKQQPFHSNDLADIIVFASIRQTATTFHMDLGSKEFVCDASKVVEVVTVPELPANIRDQDAVAAVRKSFQGLSGFAERYKKAAPILKPYLEQFGAVLSRCDNGDVRYDGRWISKTEYAAMLDREQKVREQMRQAEEEKKRLRQIEDQKEALFAAEQRKKGLEKYGQQWLPKAEVAVMLKRDRELQLARDEVKAKSISKMSYAVFQLVPEGMLVEPRGGTIIQGGLNSELLMVYGAAKGTAAEGDMYRDDVYWCGTYNYTTKSGRDKTVHAYCFDQAEAIARVRETLFGAKEEDEPARTPVTSAPPRSSPPNMAAAPPAPSSPLDGASSTGSGFFIGSQGHFVTNAHVVGSASSVGIYYRDKVLPARVVNVSKIADLALLKTEANVEGLVLAEEQVDLGMDVYAIGFPHPDIQGIEVKVTKGVISSQRGLDNDDTRFQIDAAIQPGNSGGPLCDASGHLVGVVVATLNSINVAKMTGNIPQNVNYAIKASELSAFLRSRAITVPQAPAIPNKGASGGVKTAVACVGLVVVRE